MSDADEQWKQQIFDLPPQHGWRAKPGYKIFVADRGAVRFDFPESWVVVPGDDAIAIHDRPPPDDEVVLKVSVMRLPPIKGGWDQLPLERLVREALRGDKRAATGGDEVVTLRRGDLELAWAQVRFIDPEQKRPALSRCCLARARNIQPLITMDFWESDLGKMSMVWDEVLRSLRVGVPLGDPRRGDVMN